MATHMVEVSPSHGPTGLCVLLGQVRLPCLCMLDPTQQLLWRPISIVPCLANTGMLFSRIAMRFCKDCRWCSRDGGGLGPMLAYI